MLETFSTETFQEMLTQTIEIGLPFALIAKQAPTLEKQFLDSDNMIHLPTGV